VGGKNLGIHVGIQFIGALLNAGFTVLVYLYGSQMCQIAANIFCFGFRDTEDKHF